MFIVWKYKFEGFTRYQVLRQTGVVRPKTIDIVADTDDKKIAKTIVSFLNDYKNKNGLNAVKRLIKALAQVDVLPVLQLQISKNSVPNEVVTEQELVALSKEPHILH